MFQIIIRPNALGTSRGFENAINKSFSIRLKSSSPTHLILKRDIANDCDRTMSLSGNCVPVNFGSFMMWMNRIAA